jgi:hypothetical protein
MIGPFGWFWTSIEWQNRTVLEQNTLDQCRAQLSKAQILMLSHAVAADDKWIGEW